MIEDDGNKTNDGDGNNCHEKDDRDDAGNDNYQVGDDDDGNSLLIQHISRDSERADCIINDIVTEPKLMSIVI